MWGWGIRHISKGGRLVWLGQEAGMNDAWHGLVGNMPGGGDRANGQNGVNELEWREVRM